MVNAIETGTVEKAGEGIVKYTLIENEGLPVRFFSEECNPVNRENAW